MVDLKKLKELVDRTEQAWPAIQERAIQTGDWTEADQAGKVMDRLSDLVDRHASEIGQQESTPAQQPVARVAAPEPSALEAPTEPMPPVVVQRVKNGQEGFGAPPSAHSLADLMSSNQSSPTYDITPDQVAANRKALYATGYGEPPLSPEEIAKNRETLYATGYGEPKSGPMERVPNSLRSLMNSTGGSLSDILAQRDENRNAATQADETTQKPVDLPFPTPNPGSEGGKPDLRPVLDDVKEEFGGDVRKFVRSVRGAAQDDDSGYEREYLRQLEARLGKRPESGTPEKVLGAILYGAASIFSRWASNRWGGAVDFPDLNEDQRDYDRKAFEIGKEVYGARQARQRSELGTASRSQIEQAKEEGRNERLAKSEEGKTARQQSSDAMKERVANIRAASSGKTADRMSMSDKARLDELKMKYNALDHTLMTVDPKVRLQGDAILTEIERIIKKYADAGK